MADINLMPGPVRRVQRTQKIVRLLNVVGVGVFLLTSLVSGGVFFYSAALGRSKASLERSVKREREKIGDLLIIERDAHKLEAKAAALEEILAKRSSYSRLLGMLAVSTPPEVAITELVSAPRNAVNVSGNAQSYVALAKFLLKVLDENQGGGQLFTTADLTSVGLDRQTGRAKFAVTLHFKEEGLALE